MEKKLLLIFFACWIAHPLVCQNRTDRTSSRAAAVAAYNQATALSQYLFTGGRYHIYDRKAETHQFFHSRELQEGTLRYDGRDFGPLRMLYDTHLGLVIVEQPRNGYLVQLQPSNIQEFTIGGHTFLLIDQDPVLGKGWYDQLHSGKTQLLCERKKNRIEKIVDRLVEVNFFERNRYYIRLNDTYQEVTSRKKLLTVLGTHKSAIKRQFRKQNLVFREDKEQAIVTAVQLYDQLENRL